MANESSNTNSGNQDQGGNSSQSSPQQGLYENQDLYLGSQKPNENEDNAYAETTTGLGYSEQQADSAQAQNWERQQQAGQVPGQQVGPTTGKDFEHASGVTGYYGGTTQEEQQGQKANVEQAHDSNTAQYTGKPGTKAPSPGQQSGTAWGQDMELGNDQTPARDPDSY